MGWAGQLPFEPTLGLRFHLAQVIWGAPGPSPVARLAASGTLQLGTPLTDVEAGLRATMGWHAPPPWERTAHRATARPLGVYAIGAVRGDLVGYDEFLDGTVFRGSPSVARRWVVGQAEVGVGVAIHRVHIEWTVIHRARAYSTQPDPHTYSRLDFGWD